jgi:two-component system, chemotaxis family, CheB/CheR fusion protein
MLTEERSIDRGASVGVPTVGIGASAGGLKAMQAFFESIAPDLGAAYVVIVHLDPEHQSELASILGQRTKMPVSQVQERVRLMPNNVYVIPPNSRLLITDQEIGTYPFDEPRGRRSPIDQFFVSLADQHGDGFAIILSGAGSDGSQGIKAIKEGGGLILVQDPEEAEYSSMPRSAIQTGLADFVDPVRDLASRLSELISNKRHLPTQDLVENDEEVLKRILSHLRGRTGHDFSLYKRSTVLRRLGRRMQINRVELLEDYYTLLRANPEEVQNLFTDLLISVTTFFRDPPAFDVLMKDVIKPMFEDTRQDEPVRVWVPGCATGEEAYSIAMLLAEEAARKDVPPTIQVFASDLDTKALAVAREGRYGSTIEADVGDERLKRFFVRESDHYRVKRELRDLILFTSHSVLKDPPFSKLDLISCRNLLIYLDRDLQQQVCATFHYALKPGGYLFLGSSESADAGTGYFQTINRETRIYRAFPVGKNTPRHLPTLALSPRNLAFPAFGPPPPSTFEKASMLHRHALEEMAPPSVLVDREYRVIHMSETAGRFLQPSGGQLTADVTELVRPELRFDLRAGLHNSFEKSSSELSLPIPISVDGVRKRMYLQVWPVSKGGERHDHALVLFIEGALITSHEDKPISSPANDPALNDRVVSLQEELELTRARLRTSREEFEGANEELRAANEELQSINEEYRSTAEELETSKEELQSINEELQTVNNELKSKLETVSRSKNDMQNLMAATNVGTLFLDKELRIKRFTPPIAALFNITMNDEGRSITDFTHRLDYGALADDASKVLRDLTPIEREVSSGGSWFLTRLRPYRTADERIEGIVVTFIDVTERLAAEQNLKTSEGRARLLLQELSHRVKNSLTVVQSIARLTFKESVPNSVAVDAFSGRLGALSQAHEVLVHNDWSGARLGHLIEKQLAPHVAGNEGRINIEGPEVILPPELATPFALTLHELATNALKYGALSKSEGTLSLSWSFNEDDGDLVLFWRENGNAKPTPGPAGFGSYLIERGIPGADVSRILKPEGLVCTIKVRIPFLKEKT